MEGDDEVGKKCASNFPRRDCGGDMVDDSRYH
jgi:hypothetical protein